MRACLVGILFLAAVAGAQECVKCHTKVTPGIVKDWQVSEHAKHEVDCAACHGEGHVSADDVAKVKIPTPFFRSGYHYFIHSTPGNCSNTNIYSGC